MRHKRAWALLAAIIAVLMLMGAHRSPADQDRPAWKFLHHQPGLPDVPVAYDPCETLHVVVNDHTAPPGSEGLVDEAVVEVAHLTGLHVVIDGSTSRQPTPTGAPDEIAWLGAETPALIAWTAPRRVHQLVGSVLAVGGSSRKVDGVSELMYKSVGALTDFGPGDRVGLGALGAGRCVSRSFGG